jgi:SAM-dependent methyltransferase
MPYYGAGLAWIQDAGFRDYSLGAAPGLTAILRRHGIRNGLVADLGCGSGHWCGELCRRGYGALGIDRSAHLLRLARRNAPGAAFRAGSLWTVELPPCAAVTSLGECINYADESRTPLDRLFRRIRRALAPGGVWIFDAAGPSRSTGRNCRVDKDWAVLSKSTIRGRLLTRRIVWFRKMGAGYRRGEETHRLRLYTEEGVLGALHAAGFSAKGTSAFGGFRLPAGITGYICTADR